MRTGDTQDVVHGVLHTTGANGTWYHTTKLTVGMQGRDGWHVPNGTGEVGGTKGWVGYRVCVYSE